jgi:hypothetical protein
MLLAIDAMSLATIDFVLDESLAIALNVLELSLATNPNDFVAWFAKLPNDFAAPSDIDFAAFDALPVIFAKSLANLVASILNGTVNKSIPYVTFRLPTRCVD